MVRFARAKGSKASNERVPEKATSWAEMKQQLEMKNQEIEDNKKRQEINDQRNANYRAFLEEREENESKNTTWADFPVTNTPVKKNKLKKTAKINGIGNGNDDGLSEDDEEFENLRKKVDQALTDLVNNGNLGKVNDAVSPKKKPKKKKAQTAKNDQMVDDATRKGTTEVVKESNKIDSDSDAPPDEESAKKEVPKPKIKIKKPKQKKLKIVDGKEEKGLDNNKMKKKRKLSANTTEAPANKKLKTDGKGKKNKKENNKKVVKENLTELDLKKIEKKKQKRLKQVMKKKKIKEELKKQKQESAEQEGTKNEGKDEKNKVVVNTDTNKRQNGFKEKFDKHNNNNNINTNIKKGKIRDKEEHARKRPLQPHKMFINGKELDIEYLDGFPVKKEDAERIKKLRKEMISKGLPRSEINISLKLERRKAEKALAREKKKVCFNCRKSGHNLSECPDLNKDQVAHTAGSGICFKCGSTEHTHFECRVVRGQEFKFAQCFICNEQGHIARQCPDNARGLYPKGGACKVCGDVTHLKKDCPTYQAQQQRQEGSLKLETFGDSNPDVLEENGRNVKQPTDKRPNKIIKF